MTRWCLSCPTKIAQSSRNSAYAFIERTRPSCSSGQSHKGQAASLGGADTLEATLRDNTYWTTPEDWSRLILQPRGLLVYCPFSF